MGLNFSTNLPMFLNAFQAMWRHMPLKEYSVLIGIRVAYTSFSPYTLGCDVPARMALSRKRGGCVVPARIALSRRKGGSAVSAQMALSRMRGGALSQPEWLWAEEVGALSQAEWLWAEGEVGPIWPNASPPRRGARDRCLPASRQPFWLSQALWTTDSIPTSFYIVLYCMPASSVYLCCQILAVLMCYCFYNNSSCEGYVFSPKCSSSFKQK